MSINTAIGGLSGTTKYLITSLATICAAGITAWGTVAATAQNTGTSVHLSPTQASDVRLLLAKEDPYLQDRKFILVTLSQHSSLLNKIEDQVTAIEISVAKK